MSERFDIIAVIENFKKSLTTADGDIKIADYVSAYEELSKLLKKMGKIFTFVEADVAEKRQILRDLHTADADAYKTLKSMVRIECPPPVNVPKAQGLRTFLRLHRALAFIIMFIESIEKCEANASIAKIFSESYNKTLAHHHTWLIRKSVSLAAHAVPNRAQLLERIFESVEDQQNVDNVAREFSIVIGMVYERVQIIYEEFKLLDLP
ncbi:GLTP domain-containing protein [Aphelenchoides besseyi]|nr:GLTP domain-containing protein [Aphelenchoides besseyi]KAI6210437.1 GLTP domain-containing protein [Aphelenchoides besseyi]